MKILKTYEDLRSRLINDVTDHEYLKQWLKYQTIDEAVFWFVAWAEAQSFIDFTTKDIASILLEGTKPIDKEYVVGWLETMYEDAIEDEDYLLQCDETMTALINMHFGWD